MTKSRKYNYKLEQEGSTWTAIITRQITSKKVVVSKQQSDFVGEKEAKGWAEQQLLEFSTIQGTNNQRQGEQRKLNAEERRQRSSRRAEKTELAKQELAKQEEIETTQGLMDSSEIKEQ